MIELYQFNPCIVNKFPFRVKFKNEQAIDVGGVARDAISAFWEHV